MNSTNDPFAGTAVALDLWGGHSGVFGGGSMNGFNGILGPQPPAFKFEAGNPALATTATVLNSFATAPIGSLSTNNATFTHPTYSAITGRLAMTTKTVTPPALSVG